MAEEQANDVNIIGEPLDLDTMLNFANIDLVDIESAILWWDDHASPEWVGALEAPEYTGDE